MPNLDVHITFLEERKIYGLWAASNDKTIAKDVDALSEKYYKAVSKPKGSVLPYFVLSRNYDERSRDFELFVGGTLENGPLTKLLLLAGEYARITVKPKLGFLWGLSIGEAKRYFYTKWLPESRYQARNMEYEYHTEASKGKHLSIEIMFAICVKDD